MPLDAGGNTTNTTTTAANMEVESFRGLPAAGLSEKAGLCNNTKNANHHEFGESQCLFCDLQSSDLDQNLAHMSKTHGLFVDPTNLLVDVASLLAYFDLVISECHECLYCGTQRNTRQAAQQHMIAKGHCKYDITHEDSEFSDFYEFPSSSATGDEQRRQDLARMHLDNSDHPQLPMWVKTKKPRPLKRTDAPADDAASSSSDSLSDHEPMTSGAVELRSRSAGRVSARALKQEDTLSHQLTQLRAGDRRSLAHLPDSQQRALLATSHKQMEKARRTEQTQRGNLESAGNKFGCLGKIRLIRKPPHMGHVASLNR